MKFNRISVVALLLVLCLCVFAGCKGTPDTTETDPTPESDPVVTGGDSESVGETEPAGTDPVVTEPEETEPAVTEPKETEPAVTEPVVTEPKDTEPAVTEPKETEPAVTEPAETEPKETEPKETEPKETEPEETTGAHVCVGVNFATNPTCYSEGTYTMFCTICGADMGTTVFASKLPHTVDPTIASCEAPLYCTVCGEFVSDITPHNIENPTEKKDPSFLEMGYEKGACTICGDAEAINELQGGVFEDFDDMDVGVALDKELFTGEKSGFSSYFDFTPIEAKRGTVTIEEEANGNKYWLTQTTTTGNGTYVKDLTGKLAYEPFEVSMKLKFFNTSDNVRLMSLMGDGKNESALLSYKNGLLSFGSNNNNAAGVTIVNVENHVDRKTGEYKWIEIRVVVDPRTVNYTIYVNDTLALRTTTAGDGTHNIYDGAGTKSGKTLEKTDKTPFTIKGKLDTLYFAHYAVAKFGIDDFSVKILDFHDCTEYITEVTYDPTCTEDGYKVMECVVCGTEYSEQTPIPATGHTFDEATTKTVESTCAKQGYTVKVCTVCGAEDDKTTRIYADKLPHTPNIGAATCTDNKKCTVCGEILEKALGHEGTTIVPATFCVTGNEYGFCTRCEKEIDDIIPAGITEDFEGFAVGNFKSQDLSTSVLSNVLAYDGVSSVLSVADNNGNKILQKVNNGQFTMTDKTGLLATQKFAVSFDLHVDAMDEKQTNYSGGILSVKDGAERRVLSLMGGKMLCFGKEQSGVYVLKNDIYQDGNAPWINIKVVVDPTTYDYEIWLDGELILYTTPVDITTYKHLVWRMSGGEWVSTETNAKNGNLPFAMSGDGINQLYFFHFSHWTASVDNLTVSVVGGTDHKYEAKSREATCTIPSATWDECVWCGDTKNYEEIGEPDASKHIAGALVTITEPTCTEEGVARSFCTICGVQAGDDVVLSAKGHSWQKPYEVMTAPTFTAEGLGKVKCANCGAVDEEHILPKQVCWDFDDMEIGNLSKDMMNGVVNTAEVEFATDLGTSHFVAEENGNKYWKAAMSSSAGSSLFIKDYTGQINVEKFVISLNIRLTDKNKSGRIIALKTDSKPNDEMAILSCLNGTLVFGKNDSNWGVVVADGDTIYKDGAYQWVSVKIEFDPLYRNYVIYINNELVLYTTSDPTRMVYKVSDGVATETVVDKTSDKSPFRVGNIHSIYMFHSYGLDLNVDIDDFCVIIPETHKCDADVKTESKEETCVEAGYTREVCVRCGKVVSETSIEASGAHEYALAAPTCTEDKVCGVCGYVEAKALGHEGTTVVPATINATGSETGHCTRCDTDIDVVIPAGIVIDFDDQEEGALTRGAFTGYGDGFEVLVPSDASVVTEGTNKFVKKTGAKQTLTIKDLNGALSSKFAFSMDVRFDGETTNSGLISVKDNTEAANEHRILSTWTGGKVRFGKNTGLDFLKPGNEWFNIRVVVDPATYDYEIWVNGEKVIYTTFDETADVHTLWQLTDGEWTSKEISGNLINEGTIPTDPSVGVSRIYLFHVSGTPLSFDNMKLEIFSAE